MQFVLNNLVTSKVPDVNSFTNPLYLEITLNIQRNFDTRRPTETPSNFKMLLFVGVLEMDALNRRKCLGSSRKLEKVIRVFIIR